MTRTLFTCRCSSIEHSFVVSADEDYLAIEVHLAALPFWRRLRVGVHYIFGGKSKWGDFEEVLLSPYQALDLGDKLVEWSQGENIVFAPNDVY